MTLLGAEQARVYYVNPTTNKSVWDRPLVAAAPPAEIIPRTPPAVSKVLCMLLYQNYVRPPFASACRLHLIALQRHGWSVMVRILSPSIYVVLREVV